MPRSLPFSKKWRVVSIAVLFILSICFASLQAGAQRRTRPAQPPPGTTAATTPAQTQAQKNLTRMSASETPEGSSITIVSDSALNDYSAYRSGERFYVLIPGADASRVVSGLRGRGFTDVRAQKRGNDVLLSFRLLAGATARVNQKFNRLEIRVTVPALVANNAQANTANNNAANNNAGTQSTSSTNNNTGSSTAINTNPRPQGSTGTPSFNNNSSNPTGTTPDGTGTRPQNSGTGTNPNFNNPPTGIPVGPDGLPIQPGTINQNPLAQASPTPFPSVSPADQIAQFQQQQGIPPATTTNVPPATNQTPSAGAGSSFGAQLKQNWLLALLGLAIAGFILWVLVARSRADSPVERRVETLRDSKTETIAPAPATADVPAKAAIVAAPVIAAPARVEAEAEPEAAPVVAESELAAPVAAFAPVVEEAAETPAAVVADEVEAKQIVPVVPVPVMPSEPAAPVAVDDASDEVRNLLAGHDYDEAILSTQDAGARQMIAAELLAALAGRNVVRHERAQEAFVKHGYFEDATRTLRTAESPAERASAARSLGLVRDTASTPHLIAALDDPAPEVRRAAVESLAEVRDPAAVAPLEALRTREKNRGVPKTLIQHAIEASVVGRAKAEPTAPVSSPYVTTPLTEQHSPVTTPLTSEMVAPAIEEEASPTTEAEPPVTIEEPAPEALMPPAAEETASHVSQAAIPVAEVEAPPVISEETAGIEEAPPAQLSEADVVQTEIPQPPQAETIAPVATASPVVEYMDGAASDWVDVDYSRPEAESHAAPPPIAPVISEEPEAIAEEPAPEMTAGFPAPAIAEAAETAPEISAPATEQAATSDADAPVSFVLEPLASESLAAESPAPPVEKGIQVPELGKELEPVEEEELSSVPSALLRRLASEDAGDRATAVTELGRVGGEDSFREISASFDDPAPEVRDAAARALYQLNPDRAASFTRALREAPPERRRHIGSALASSGLANEAIGHLMGESREKTYDAFSLLFLMSKAGELQPLMKAVEEHPNNEVRLAVVKLLALSGQQEILPAFRRLAVRGSLPTEVRSAVMEAIYQISSQAPDTASRG